MKKHTHPPYQKVLFVDSASGHRFVCGSALQTQAKEVYEGVEYPVLYLSTSSSSHPFFTGSKQLVDAEGRVEKFNKRFDRKTKIFVVEAPKEDESASAPVPAEKPAQAAKTQAAKPQAAKPQAGKAPAKAPAKDDKKAPAKKPAAGKAKK